MWKCVDSNVLLDDKWMRLRADTCITESGDRISPYYVIDGPPLVSVLALTPEKEVVVLKQYRHPACKEILELPGGAVDGADDSVEAAARRELREETGYVVEDLFELGSIDCQPARNSNQIYCFLATGAVRAHAPEPETSEQISVTTLSIEELLSAANKSELRNPHHVCCLFWAMNLYDRLLSGNLQW